MKSPANLPDIAMTTTRQQHDESATVGTKWKAWTRTRMENEANGEREEIGKDRRALERLCSRLEEARGVRCGCANRCVGPFPRSDSWMEETAR